MKITLLDSYETEVIQHNANQFEELPFSFTEIKKETILVNKLITKAYESDCGRLILEYLNRQYLEFKSIEDHLKLNKSNVSFDVLPLNDIFTYSIRISKTDFDRMKSVAEKIETPNTLSWFGNYYKLENQQVLMEWLQPESGIYNILENIYWMMSFDYELEHVFKNWVGLGQMVDNNYVNEIDNSKAKKYQIEIHDGILLNSIESLNILAEILNLDIKDLDYSENSIDILFDSFLMNWSTIVPDYLVNPIVAYLGEMFVREYDVKWARRDSNYFLVFLDGESVNLTEEVEYELIDRECFLIENVYNSIREKMKAQNNG